jgi:hypothetical protein
MKIAWLQLTILSTSAASFSAEPYLGESGAMYLVVPPMFMCIVFGWLLVWENDGMQRTRSISEFLLYGLLVPRWSNWRKQIEMSFNGWIVAVSAAVMVGALLRIFWIIHAFQETYSK